MKRFFFGIIFSLLGAVALRAQSVHWESARGTLAVGQATALTLIYDGCEPKGNGQPSLPKVDGLSLQFYQRSDSTSMVNFSFTRTVSLTYAALLGKKQSVDIPAFDVETDKGRLRVPAAHFDPTGATVGNQGTPLETAATAKLMANPSTVWAGEVFELETTVEAAKSYYPRFQGNFDFNADPLVAENWSTPDRTETQAGGEARSGVSFKTRAIARAPGAIKLNPASHLVNLSVGLSGFGFFQQRQYDQYSVASNTPTLTVRALPIPPAGFSGAVGQFKLSSKVIPARAAVGEPVTWTLELTGSGNWPDIAGLPSREVSKDFNVVQPKAKKTPVEGKLFDATMTEDVVLVPTKAGRYTLGALEFNYFDPKTGSYKKLTSAPTTVTITEPVASQFATASASESAPPPDKSATSETTAAVAKILAPIPTLPNGLPRDLLEADGVAWKPWRARWLPIGLFSGLAFVLIGWISLAWNRARRTDPARQRREAEMRLRATLGKIAQFPDGKRTAALLDWQHDAGVIWQLVHAAPAPENFSDATWEKLWADSDRALYSSENKLPADWVARATAALGSKKAPRFSAAQLFLPRNLAPFFFALGMAALFWATKARAEDGAAAYRAGNFADAEKMWAAAAQSSPTDASARHNLSLALAQQDRWDAAAAQATAAFVQRPQDPAIQWQFALACQKAGFTPEPLAGFLRGDSWTRFVQRASGAAWQVGGAGGIAVTAIGGLLILAGAYRFRPGIFRPLGLSLAAIGILTAGISVAAEKSYGESINPDAIIVLRAGTLRSIPTEADTTQKTVPVSAGTVGRTDGEYLSWARVAFSNGQTGWIRRSEIVGLWQ